MNPSSSSACCEEQSPADDQMDDWLFLSSDSAGPQCLEVSREDRETEDRGKLKSKFVSAWNSVKYGMYYLSDLVTSLYCCCVIRADLFVLFSFLKLNCFSFSFTCIRLVLETEIPLQQELSCHHAWKFL